MLSDAELQRLRNINTGRGPTPQPDDPFWERLEVRGLATRQQVRRGDGVTALQGPWRLTQLGREIASQAT
jgi:hypothetical protein